MSRRAGFDMQVQGTIAEDGGARLASPFQRLERLAPRSF